MSGKKPHPIPGLGSSSEESDNEEAAAPQSPDIVVDRASPDSVAEEVVVTTEDEDDFEPEAEPDTTQDDDEEEPEYDPSDAPFLIRAQQKRAEEAQAGPSDLEAAQQTGGEPAPVFEEQQAMEDEGGDEDEEPEYSFAIDIKNRTVRIMTGTYSEKDFIMLERISAETFNMITERVHSPNVDDDDHFYCDQCVMSFRVCCAKHPLYRILDRTVGDKKTNNDESTRKTPVDDRARKTLPAFIKIRTSSIPKAGLGAFTNVEIPVGVVFGPYQGILSKEKDDRGYSWEIRSVDDSPWYLDGSDAKYANWMRYINSPRFDKEQNLVAFQYNGSVFYRVIKPIDAEQELLVWYGELYGKSLGVFRTKRSSNRCRLYSIKSTDVKNPFIM